MKKFTFAALGAAMALTAAAQDFTVDPSNTLVLNKNVKDMDYIVLSETAVNEFQAKGTQMNYIGPDGESAPRPLYYWEGTMTTGDASFPRVDMHEGGYISLKVVPGKGWSGAGISVVEPIDISKLTSETRFHMAFMSPSTVPASVAVILLDDEKASGSIPAKIALGDNYNDNGTIIPSVAKFNGTDWVGVDMTVGDIEKLWPRFNPKNLNAWKGTLLSFLAGGAAAEFAIDACYFYNIGEGNGISSVADENAGFVVTDRTVNVMGGNGIELYDLQGRKVLATEGTVIGLDGLQNGIYVARSGNSVQKIMVR